MPLDLQCGRLQGLLLHALQKPCLSLEQLGMAESKGQETLGASFRFCGIFFTRFAGTLVVLPIGEGRCAVACGTQAVTYSLRLHRGQAFRVETLKVGSPPQLRCALPD